MAHNGELEDKVFIRRSKHDRENPYMMLIRATAQNKQLSYDALGMLTYILSKPDDWKVKAHDLERECCGRDKARNILNELVRKGYAWREPQARGADGKYEYGDYEVAENPVFLFPPFTEKPSTVKPSTGEPYTVNPTLHSIESTALENNESKTHTKGAGDTLYVGVPPLPLRILDDRSPRAVPKPEPKAKKAKGSWNKRQQDDDEHETLKRSGLPPPRANTPITPAKTHTEAYTQESSYRGAWLKSLLKRKNSITLTEALMLDVLEESFSIEFFQEWAEEMLTTANNGSMEAHGNPLKYSTAIERMGEMDKFYTWLGENHKPEVYVPTQEEVDAEAYEEAKRLEEYYQEMRGKR